MPQEFDYLIAPKSSFDATADAIRAVNGTASDITWGQDGFADAIGNERRYLVDDINTINGDIDGAIEVTGTTLRPFLFTGNKKITSFVGNNVTSVRGDSYVSSYADSYAFYSCTNLVSISLPKVTDLYHADHLCQGCSKLETVEMNWPNMTRLGTSVFQGCSSLQKTSFVVPKLASNVYGYFISGNANLTAFDIGSASINMGNYNFAANALNGNSNLTTLVIRCTNRVYSLANVSAFSGTPFASSGRGGTLFVPESQISAYETATNWSTILGYANNQIKSIESTHTDPNASIDLTLYYADGTPIGGAS